VRCPQAI
jgi:hypothetical protein